MLEGKIIHPWYCPLNHGLNFIFSVPMRELTENVVKRVKLNIVRKSRIRVSLKLLKKKSQDMRSLIMMSTKVVKEPILNTLFFFT